MTVVEVNLTDNAALSKNTYWQKLYNKGLQNFHLYLSTGASISHYNKLEIKKLSYDTSNRGVYYTLICLNI